MTSGVHSSDNSHVLTAVTRKLYNSKLSIKILCVRVCARKTGSGALMGVDFFSLKLMENSQVSELLELSLASLKQKSHVLLYHETAGTFCRCDSAAPPLTPPPRCLQTRS